MAIAAGDAFLIVPGERARYREDLRRPWRYAWLTIDGPGALDACAAAGFPGRRRVLRGGASPAALAVLDDLRRAFAGASCSPCTAHAGLWRLAEAMSSHNQAPPRQDPEETLRRLMTNGFDEGLSIGAIAARLGVDRTTLFRRFRQRYGCNPRTYLAQVRLDRAHTLLGDGERRIADVARSCGYGDARAFARAYRRRHGCSPSGR